MTQQMVGGEDDPIVRRRYALLEKWSQGKRLSKSEFEEIRDLIPTIGEIRQSGNDETAPNAQLVAHYQKAVPDYEKVYGAGERTLKRWIAIGRAANPPELPPLDSPQEMPAWWSRHMKHRVPNKLIFASKAAMAGLPAYRPSESAAIDISALETAAGDAVRQARGYLAAADRHLTEAYASGDDARIEMCQRRWLKALDANRKAEFAANEDAKIKGEWVPLAEVIRDVGQLLEVMKQMRRAARRRILAALRFELSPDHAEQLGQAIEDELARGEAVLRHLKQFRSFEEIDQFELSDDGNDAN